MSEKIVKSLRENNPMVTKKEEEKEESPDNVGPLESSYRNRYMLRDDDIDTSFGINFLSNGETYIASTPIKIENDDIIIYNEVYDGTPGLWSLITEKKKENLEGRYSQNDLDEYAQILRQTNVLHKDFNPNSSYPRSSVSWKWKNILSPIWNKWREEDEEDVDHDGSGLIVKKFGRIWKAKRHAEKGLRKLGDGVYFRDGKTFHKLM